MKKGALVMGTVTRRTITIAASAVLVSSACIAAPDSQELEPTPREVSASRPPPPISGGTLLITADGATAVAADPDRDRVFLADLTSMSLLADIALPRSDEPGRVVEGPPGRVNVALRRGGAVVTIDVATREIVRRTPVCPAPRGIAYDSAGSIHVACAGGELVTLSAATGAEVRRLHLQPDLRDVVVQDGGLLVSVFRAARVLFIDAEGTVIDQSALPVDPIFAFEPSVAWRMVPLGGGGAAIVHQRASSNVVVTTTPGGYGESGCGDGIVHSAVSFLDAASGASTEVGPSILQSALPVDIAVSQDGSRFAVVAAGSSSVLDMPVASYRLASGEFQGCVGQITTPVAEGQPIAVAFAGSQRVIQTREPPRLVLGDAAILELPGESALDTGHVIFHQAPNPSFSLSCASCHPEGRDDGRVWNFEDVGSRRTQSVAGGILATAPLHWDGTLEGFDPLMSEVFTRRMGGPEQSPRRTLAAALWLDSVPFLPVAPPIETSSANRGKALFEDPSVGCASCHSGPRLTNNKSVDVGTGGPFQVPSLRGVAARAPFMHDGCAATLKDRFDPGCGGDDAHGVTSNLSSSDIDDIVSYLETL